MSYERSRRVRGRNAESDRPERLPSRARQPRPTLIVCLTRNVRYGVAMKTDVIMTGALLMLAILLFARAMMAAWPHVVVEMPKHPLGFVPPGGY